MTLREGDGHPEGEGCREDEGLAASRSTLHAPRSTLHARTHVRALAWVSADGKKLLAGRTLRAFGYGYVAVVLTLYLEQLGLDPLQIGAVLSAALAGSAVLTVLWSLYADRFGRRRTVAIMALLMSLGGLLFALTDNFWLLLLATFTGTISPNSSDVGSFITVEQAVLPQTAPDERRTWLFSIYNMVGNLGGALGSLFAASVGFLASLGLAGADVYRPFFLLYAAIGLANLVLFLSLSEKVELARVDGRRRFIGIHRSAGIVARLSALLALDAFAGGFVVMSFVAYWFHLRWGMATETLGVVFFMAGLVSSISVLAAGWLAGRIGLLNAMVFSHVPANVFLMLVPLAPTAWLAVLLYLMRTSTSYMDVPTRQSYMMAVVEPDERTATAGITNVARIVASTFPPALAGWAISVSALGAPFLIAGGLKIVYDGLIYAAFRHVHPPEERARR